MDHFPLITNHNLADYVPAQYCKHSMMEAVG